MNSFSRYLTAALAVVFILPATAQDTISNATDGDVSLKLEIERSLARGTALLLSSQDAASGSWGDSSIPAFTALAISAILGDPNLDRSAGLPASVEKGYEFLLTNVRDDGGIYGKGLATYNTALSVMALVQSGKQEHLPVIAKARRLLINQQQDYDQRGKSDNLFDGGIGYGGTYAHSDLSNTHLALEALYYSKKALADTEFDETEKFDLDWDAAIQFVSLTQNSDETASRLGESITVRDEDKGGFVYYPGDTKSDEIVIEAEGGKKTALRSYGSMSYAGLLSFIYADLDRDDPRIASVMDWLQKNFTLKENPGMDAQGLYYYYHTMSKALAITGTKTLVDPSGKKIDWKKELALQLMSQQKPDGSWINDGSNRWMEGNPILVTAYAMLAMEHVYRSL